MSMLPSPTPLTPAYEMELPAISPSQSASGSFGQLVQRIRQSNSGRHQALVLPKKEYTEKWAEYRSKAEQAIAESNFAYAEAMWLKAIAETNLFDVRDWRKAYSLDSMATLCFAQGRLDEAEVFCTKALEATMISFGDDSLNTAECETFFASVCFSLLKTDEAIAHAKNALAIYENLLEPEHRKIATASYNLAVIYHARGAFEEAEEYYQHAFKLRAHIYGWDHEMTTRVSKAYAEMAMDRRHHKEAREIVDRLMGPVTTEQ